MVTWTGDTGSDLLSVEEVNEEGGSEMLNRDRRGDLIGAVVGSGVEDERVRSSEDPDVSD